MSSHHLEERESKARATVAEWVGAAEAAVVGPY
jgi:hypothetical protein